MHPGESDRRCRVLVVDDRPLVQAALTEVLGAAPALGLVSAPAAAQVAVGRGPVQGLRGPVLSLELVDLDDPEAVVQAVGHVVAESRRGAVSDQDVASTPLSVHERAVLQCIADGLTAARAAERLGVSTKSVENAKRRAFVKLGARNQAEAVAHVVARR